MFSSSEGSQADVGTLRCWILPGEIFRPHLSLGWKVCSAGKGRQMAKDSDSRHRAQQGGAGRTAQGSAELCCLGGQLGLGKQEAVLRGAPVWVMGVFPRSGTKGQKLIMKHVFLIVDKRGA